MKYYYLFYNFLIINLIVTIQHLNYNKKKHKKRSIIDYNNRNNWILYYFYFISFACFCRYINFSSILLKIKN